MSRRRSEQRPSLLPLAMAFVVLALGSNLWPFPPSRARAADESPDTSGIMLDGDFYRTRVAPIVHRVCAPCHANPRKRLGKHFLRPMVGRRVKERDHKRNMETIAKYIEPGNPAASTWLLKPLGPRQGGVTHGGGQRINMNSADYGFMVDWINGAKLPKTTFRPPATEAGQPDFLYFLAHIEPALQAICAECHAGKGKGRMKLITHPRREAFPLKDHFTNFETVMKLIKVGKPDKSRFLQKPLATTSGGLRHKGGDLIVRDDELHKKWIGFISGEPGPPLPSDNIDLGHTLTALGLTLQAEACGIDGNAEVVEDKTADAFFLVKADPAVASESEESPTTTSPARAYLRADLRVDDAGAYRMTLRVRLSEGMWAWGLDPDGPSSSFALSGNEEPDAAGYVRVGPDHLTEGSKPLIDARGTIRSKTVDILNRPSETHLILDGRESVAGWLSPMEMEHNGASLHVTLPDDESLADDAVLLYRASDLDNGMFLALTDGGRRLVIGILRNGKRQVVDAAKVDVVTPEGQPTVISMQSYQGLIVGSVNSRPRVRMHLKKATRGGRIGALTRGVVTVQRIAALEEFEVYASTWTLSPIVYLPRGEHDFWISMPPGGEIDHIKFEPVTD